MNKHKYVRWLCLLGTALMLLIGLGIFIYRSSTDSSLSSLACYEYGHYYLGYSFTVDVVVDGRISVDGDDSIFFDIDIAGGTWTNCHDWANYSFITGRDTNVPGGTYYNVYNCRSTNPHWTFDGVIVDNDHPFYWSSPTTSGVVQQDTRVILNFRCNHDFGSGTSCTQCGAPLTNYTVHFNANSSYPASLSGESTQTAVSGTMSDQTMTFNATSALSANQFSRSGYTFTGWNTKADGTGTSYSDRQSVTNMVSTSQTEITLYAQWAKSLGTETITVVDEVTGNPMSGVNMTLQKNVNGTWTDVTTGVTNTSGGITVNNLYWFSYRWVVTGVPTGYRISSSCPSFSITHNNLSATNSVTLYRIWYKVRYDANSSQEPDYQTGEYKQNTVTGTMADSDYQYGVTGTLRANAHAREGYTFTGWNTRTDGSGTAYTNGYDGVYNWTDADGGVITLYAQWTKKLGTETVTVTDEITGNPVSGVSMTLQKNVNGTWTDVTTGTTNTSGKITVNDMHWFSYRWVITGVPTGYRVSSSYPSFSITYNSLSATNSITLYRIWYKVRYDANGSQEPDYQTGEYKQNTTTGTMADSDYQYDVTGTLRTNAFAREGYTFAGWNTRADGSGTSYKDGYDGVYNWTDADGGIITLYAQWEKKLGTETITVLSEETGNPVSGVGMTLQKNVDGRWTDVVTGTTGSSGKITVNDLHWFGYRWVITSVPAGYEKPSSYETFTITYNRLSAKNEVILYMKRVSITLDSRVSDIIPGENPPAFLYHISGRDVAGVSHEYNVMVQTDSTGYGTETVTGLFAGEYSVIQIPVSRYNPGTVNIISNAAANGTNATADVKNNTSAEVLFPYNIKEYGWYYGTDSAVNSLNK